MIELPSWVKGVLDDAGRERIEAAIGAADSRTSGEIVPLVLRRSSTVGHVPLLALTLLLLCVWLGDLPARCSALGGPELAWMGAWWALAAVLAWGLARLQSVQRLLTPRADQSQQVDARAQIEFYELDIRRTKGKTGVLLMASLMEHRAVVLADRAIAEQLDAEVWQEVVDRIVAGVKAGDLARGLVEAIERCGELLAPHFPIAEGDVNELRDHLVVKE